jgi:hypothetical protein
MNLHIEPNPIRFSPPPVFPVRQAGQATDDLHDTIKKQIEAMNRSSVVITRLTWVAVFIGAIQVLIALAPFAPTVIKLSKSFDCALSYMNLPNQIRR